MVFSAFCPNSEDLDDIRGDGLAIKQTFIISRNILTIRLMRKVGFSWQRTGLDIIIDKDERKVCSELVGELVRW